MEYREVERLADQLRETLQAELKIKHAQVDKDRYVAHLRNGILSRAIVEKQINGKNVKDREVQRTFLLWEDGAYRDAVHEGIKAGEEVDAAALEVKHIQALIKLTVAWLNSQQGVGQLLPCTKEHASPDCYDDQVVKCVRESGLLPEQVFESNDLAAWAIIDNGFIQKDDLDRESVVAFAKKHLSPEDVFSFAELAGWARGREL